MSATKLAELLRAREVSAVEAVEAFIERQLAVNDMLNAVVMNSYARARAGGQGARRACGARRLRGSAARRADDDQGLARHRRRDHHRRYLRPAAIRAARRTRPSSRACAAAGAILLGKTNTPEFTLGGLGGISTSSNLLYGSSHNPYDLTRSTAGSSGGAGASVAAGPRGVRHRLRLGWIDSRPVAQQRHRGHQADERARAAHGAHRRLRRHFRPLAAARPDGATRRGPRAHHADHQRPRFSRRVVRAGAVGRSGKRWTVASCASRAIDDNGATSGNATDDGHEEDRATRPAWLQGTAASVQHEDARRTR